MQAAGFNKGGGSTAIPVFGVDATDAAKDLISKGQMAGTVKQDAAGMATALLHLGQNALEGKDLLSETDDFTIDELIKYIEFAEELYEKHHRHVSVYLLCPDIVDVYVREGEIKSEADFTIKLACVEQNLPQMTLDIIKNKLKREGFLDREDLEILEILPVVCKRKDRKYFRRECLKIKNEIYY